MTNKSFAVSVTKFFYFANNYNCVPITYHTLFNGEVTRCLPEFFKAFEPYMVEHLLGKWEYRYENAHGHSASAMIEFYADLDGDNRAKLCKWINENYKHKEKWGINLNEFKKVE